MTTQRNTRPQGVAGSPSGTTLAPQARMSELMDWKVQRNEVLRRRNWVTLSAGIALSLALVYALFEYRVYDDEVNQVAMMTDDVIEIIDAPPPTYVPPPPPPKVQPTEVVEVPDEVELEDELEIDLDMEIDDETAVQEVIITESTVEAPPLQEEVVEEIFTIVEDRPEPVGGMAAFYAYLSEHLEYPSQARRLGISGRVFVQFVVDTDGTLTQLEVVKGVGHGLDEEAVRVLEAAPPWKPGKQRGRAVKVRMVVPIMFHLMDNSAS